jgi:AcrR family transcriptional regulator
MTATPTGRPTRPLPRGPHDLDRGAVAASQRARLIAAITEEVNSNGYAATTVADVIERAGISRRTFYEQFANKEDCFLAAFDEGQAQLGEAILTATTGAGEDPDARLTAGYEALCRGLAEQPAFARAFTIAAPAAGEAVQSRRVAWREASIERLCRLYESTPKDTLDAPEQLSPTIARAIVGAVEALIGGHIEQHDAESLPELAPTLVSVARALMFTATAAPLNRPEP